MAKAIPRQSGRAGQSQVARCCAVPPSAVAVSGTTSANLDNFEATIFTVNFTLTRARLPRDCVKTQDNIGAIPPMSLHFAMFAAVEWSVGSRHKGCTTQSRTPSRIKAPTKEPMTSVRTHGHSPSAPRNAFECVVSGCGQGRSPCRGTKARRRRQSGVPFGFGGFDVRAASQTLEIDHHSRVFAPCQTTNLPN